MKGGGKNVRVDVLESIIPLLLYHYMPKYLKRYTSLNAFIYIMYYAKTLWFSLIELMLDTYMIYAVQMFGPASSCACGM